MYETEIQYDAPLYKKPEYLEKADALEYHLSEKDRLMKEIVAKWPNKELYEWRIVNNRPYFVKVRD